VLSADRLGADGVFDPPTVARLLDRHASGQEDLSRQLWGLMGFALWQRRVPA
jgi:hypothetical protein